MTSTTRIILTAMLAGMFVACGGGDDSGDSSNASVGNNAPAISGAAPSPVSAGNAYSFTPTASDSDGDSLTFSVQNLPAWATFNATTGQISGTPEQADLGQYANIVVSVSDGADSANLAAFSITVVAGGSGSAMLSWTPPDQNTDGSTLTDLDGYRIYWGPSEGNYTQSVTLDNEGMTSYVVEGLTTGTWYFVTTAFNASGIESGFSNVASKSVL